MPPQYPQDSSLFFQKLPPELRLDIYSYVFCSTRLSFGRRSCLKNDKRSDVRLRPAPNSLSALRVCRRFNDEIGDSWLGQVLFNFESSPVKMLDKLADLDRHTLGKVRHMRISFEQRLSLRTQELFEEGYGYKVWCFRLVHILKLLSGLKLDTLTVLGPSVAQWRYDELDALINHSDGWKELYYLSNNSVMLGFGKYDKLFGWIECDTDGRTQQPSTWTQALAARDGPTASVTIHRSRDAALSGSIISDPSSRQAFADQVAESGNESKYGLEQDSALMTPGEKEKEILVVARRGKGIDYTENGTSPIMEHDIRKYWPDMTWGQIRYMGIDWHDEGFHRAFDYDDDDEDEDEDEVDDYDYSKDYGKDPWAPPESEIPAGTEVDAGGLPIKEDTYRHVDDYEWSYLHTVYPPN